MNPTPYPLDHQDVRVMLSHYRITELCSCALSRSALSFCASSFIMLFCFAYSNHEGVKINLGVCCISVCVMGSNCKLRVDNMNFVLSWPSVKMFC